MDDSQVDNIVFGSFTESTGNAKFIECMCVNSSEQTNENLNQLWVIINESV